MRLNSETTFLGHFSENSIFDVLKTNFETCDKFFLSVSFIRETGLFLIKDLIDAALARGATGQIITCDYMQVTDVSSLQTLLDLSNKYKDKLTVGFIEINSISEYKTFHTKGYVFVKGDEASIIIGSSNLSETALSKNGGEWSLFSKTASSDKLYLEIENEFNLNKSKYSKLLTQQVIDRYSNSEPLSFNGQVTPNFMQLEALKKIAIARKQGTQKALIVAAMGSGKTLLSAFDSVNAQAKRILYVCHSETILRNAAVEYERVYASQKTYGFYFDKYKQTDKDIIFASNQSLARHLVDFGQSDFDYIVIDEAHHTPASTFKKILSYFKCNFLLGMTGTPDRLDRQNVLSYFDSKVPYELSLRDAIKLKLIMPFKYVSVSDKFVDYDVSVAEGTLVSQMTTDAHGAFVDQQIKANLGDISGKLKCLAFCVNVEHANQMAALMAKYKYGTAVITGETSGEDRQKIYKRIQDEKDPLQIVFSVNVLNEGVNLPSINMALFLRPTESSTIFIQQLGRSLRIVDGKKKPVIIDFIGKKYQRSIYIAWALGTLTAAPVLTKPILINVLLNESKTISDIGVEIKIDDQAKTEIKNYLENYNFNRLDVLKKSYEDYKHYHNLTSFPSQVAFASNIEEFDLMRIISTHKSYYNFLVRIKEFNIPQLSQEEKDFIEYISSFLPLTRPYEFRILSCLLEYGPSSKGEIKQFVMNALKDQTNFSEDSFENALNVLQRKCDSERVQNTSVKYVVLNEDGKYELKAQVTKMDITKTDDYIELNFNNSNFRKLVEDTLAYGLTKFDEEYDGDGNDFELYHPYSRTEYTRIVNFKSVYNFQPGVFYGNENRVALFIDLKKKADVEEHLNYGDKFINKEYLEWESQTETIIGNNRYNKLVNCPVKEVFVRKFQEEDGVRLPYIYLGTAKLTNPRKTTNKQNSVKFDVILDKELPDNLFEQFNIVLDK